MADPTSGSSVKAVRMLYRRAPRTPGITTTMARKGIKPFRPSLIKTVKPGMTKDKLRRVAIDSGSGIKPSKRRNELYSALDALKKKYNKK